MVTVGRYDPAAADPAVVTAADMVAGHVTLDISCLDRVYLNGFVAKFTAPAALVMTAIIAIQAFVFQDGGVLALGANVFNMAIALMAAKARALPGRTMTAHHLQQRARLISYAGSERHDSIRGLAPYSPPRQVAQLPSVVFPRHRQLLPCLPAAERELPLKSPARIDPQRLELTRVPQALGLDRATDRGARARDRGHQFSARAEPGRGERRTADEPRWRRSAREGATTS